MNCFFTIFIQILLLFIGWVFGNLFSALYSRFGANSYLHFEISILVPISIIVSCTLVYLLDKAKLPFHMRIGISMIPLYILGGIHYQYTLLKNEEIDFLKKSIYELHLKKNEEYSFYYPRKSTNEKTGVKVKILHTNNEVAIITEQID